MRKLSLGVVLAVTTASVLALVPLAAARTKTTTVDVKAVEFSFKLTTKTLSKPGTVTFVVKNDGHLLHDFKIDGKKTPMIQPGRARS